MKKLVLLLVLMFCIACDPIKGDLTVDRAIDLNVTVEQPSDWCDDEFPDDCTEEVDKTVTIQPGTYESELRFKSKRKMIFTIIDRGDKKTMTVKLPKGQKLPEDNGQFEFKASQIGQKYNINGSVATTVTQTNPRRDRESCRYEERIRECHRQGQRTICRDRIITRWGYQNVEYYLRKETKAVQFAMALPQLSQEQPEARFSGNRTFHRKIYVYKGICF